MATIFWFNTWKFTVIFLHLVCTNSFYFIPNTAMRLLLTIFLFHFLSNTAFSQWKLLNSNLDTLGISAIYTNDSIWLAGHVASDAMWYSTDKGKSWKTNDKVIVYEGFPYLYSSIAMNNKGNVVAGGILGDTGFWTTYSNQGRKRVARGQFTVVWLTVPYANEEWVRVEEQGIFRSLDNGINWIKDIGIENNFFTKDAIEKNGILYGYNYDRAFVSLDKGRTFQNYPVPIGYKNIDVFAVSENDIIGFFKNETNFSIYSSPLGAKPAWSFVSDIVDFSLAWKTFRRDNHLFVLSRNSIDPVYYSANLGKTFVPVRGGLKITSFPYCVHIVGDTVLLGTTRGIYWTKLSEIDKAIVLANENNIDKELLIYPNPTENHLILEHSTPIIKVEVFDLNGNLLKSDFQKISPIKYQVNIENLPTGMYLIQASTNHQNLTKRFLKK
jgi:Secretion system C-terminal sorting domain